MQMSTLSDSPEPLQCHTTLALVLTVTDTCWGPVDRDTYIADTHASVYNIQAFLKSGGGLKSRRALRY